MEVPPLAEVPFLTQFQGKFKGQEYTITRSGYTGEDGFEISSTGPNVVAITDALLGSNANSATTLVAAHRSLLHPYFSGQILLRGSISCS